MAGIVGPQILGQSDIHQTIAAVDKDFGIAVRYVGDEESGTVIVSATDSDMTFQHGDIGSEAVDATIDSGGDDAGIIDMSDSSGMTMGEVVDLINASANWEAMLIGSMRADIATDALETLSEAQAKVHADKSVLINFWGGIAIERTTATKYRTAGTSALAIGLILSNKDLDGNLNFGRRNVLAFAELSCTNGGTTEVNTIDVYKVDDKTGVETLIFSKPLGDDPSAVIIDDADFGDLLMSVDPGYGILVRLDADAATTSATLTAPTFFIVGSYLPVSGGANARWYQSEA